MNQSQANAKVRADSTVRVGLCGAAGEIAEQHLRAISETSGFELAALCDRSLATDPQAVHRRYGDKFDLSGVSMFASYDEMLGSRKLDAVSIATPNFLHAQQSIAGLHAGLHVLVEKPMATSVVDGEQMIAAAKLTDKLLQVALHFQFSPEVRHFVERREEFGAIEGFQFECGGCFPAGRAWFLNKAQSGGGPLMDMGANALSVLRAVFGADDFRVQGTRFEYASGDGADAKIVRVVENGRAALGGTPTDNEVESRALVQLTVRGIPGTVGFDWTDRRAYRAATTLRTETGVVTLDHAGHRLLVDGRETFHAADRRYHGIYEDFLTRLTERRSNAAGALADVAAILKAYDFAALTEAA